MKRNTEWAVVYGLSFAAFLLPGVFFATISLETGSPPQFTEPEAVVRQADAVRKRLLRYLPKRAAPKGTRPQWRAPEVVAPAVADEPVPNVQVVQVRTAAPVQQIIVQPDNKLRGAQHFTHVRKKPPKKRRRPLPPQYCECNC